jgi:hypothetical protein
MKPRNKFQQQVVQASKSLPVITKKQIEWGYENAFEYLGRRTDKGVITCTKCAHTWQGYGYLVDTLTDCKCPNCQTKLNVKTTKKRVFSESSYMTLITSHQGFQVLRTLMIKCVAKVGETPKYSHSEVMQRWIASNGKYCTFARLRQTMGTCYYDAWIFHTSLELRAEIDVYNRIFTGTVYHRQKLIPELKRAGYEKNFYGQKPLDLFRTLLSDSRAETLIKTGYTSLLKRIMNIGWKKIEDYWASIRICVRNNYTISDATLWCDYIDLLRFFGKDLHNAKYVCPADLHAEHDRYMQKKAKTDMLLEQEKLQEKEVQYKEAKAKFFGLVFSDGHITVKVLESVADMVSEGKLMHHCVASYHSRVDSLIFSASVNGQRIETVEVSISKLRVIQCRGYKKNFIIKTK